ncbi:hypothetical protein NLG97_g7305 [Lecanicillium saksenae]|uniref:Uncharacterized protein n=1 Tax=Lecanicillium saksenae TaxID=468837 RepID=A0ACC1QPJ1_9HYPO|nr:hypothetical protein NLG97_g7305 [Lecanicillium saksenae]
MHFPTAIVLGALSARCAADSLEVYQRCTAIDSCEGLGYFKTDYGETEVSGNGGCHRTNVPYLEEFCIDWSSGKVTFRFGHQNKRCMLLVSTQDWRCSFRYCYKQVFQEISCNWAMAKEEPQDDGALPFSLKEEEK